MSNAVFPASSLPGLTWGVKRTPRFKTLIAEAANAFTVRTPLWRDQLYDFECSFEFLQDSPTDVNTQLATLLTFFNARQGSFDSFLLPLSQLTQNPLDGNSSGIPPYTLPSDVNRCVPLLTPLKETIYELASLSLYNDGTLLSDPAQYTVYSAPQTANGDLNANGITYRGCVAVIAGSVSLGTITATPSWYWRVRFAQDMQDFEAFSYLLYEAQTVKLTVCRE